MIAVPGRSAENKMESKCLKKKKKRAKSVKSKALQTTKTGGGEGKTHPCLYIREHFVQTNSAAAPPQRQTPGREEKLDKLDRLAAFWLHSVSFSPKPSLQTNPVTSDV